MTATELHPRDRLGDGRPALPDDELDPGSITVVPRRARAGAMINGRAPIGSHVEVDGKPIPVQTDGRFSFTAPHTSQEEILVRILPASETGAPATYRIKVDPR